MYLPSLTLPTLTVEGKVWWLNNMTYHVIVMLFINSVSIRLSTNLNNQLIVVMKLSQMYILAVVVCHNQVMNV